MLELTPDLLQAFSTELQKLATTPTPHVPVVPGSAGTKLKMVGAGALTLGTYLGGKRLYDDVRMGEQMRRSQMGGGYY